MSLSRLKANQSNPRMSVREVSLGTTSNHTAQVNDPLGVRTEIGKRMVEGLNVDVER